MPTLKLAGVRRRVLALRRRLITDDKIKIERGSSSRNDERGKIERDLVTAKLSLSTMKKSEGDCCYKRKGAPSYVVCPRVFFRLDG